jgi:hypothetical protein
MRRVVSLLLLMLLIAAWAVAQTAAVAFCKLDRDLDFKNAKAGDKVTLKLSRDLVFGGETLLPAGTMMFANVTEAKDANTVSLVLEKATTKSGKEVELMGIVAAVAEPRGDLTEDPIYQMNRSTEVTQHNSTNPAVSTATSGAAAQTAILKGANDPKSNLTEDSQGAIGISGLKLTWLLDKPPATTVLTSKKKNFKLKSGTEILLRMARPKV